MVLGVCRRLLGNLHDAEDAFQATFLVLMRKGASVVPRDLVGNWLHGVACRTALATKAAGARRRLKESHVQPVEKSPSQADQSDHQELLKRLDLVLAGLPDKYRAALVCCELEGKSRKEASRLLGCPEGTLATRLKRGRRLLAQRLSARGTAVSAVALSLLLSQCAARAAVPGPLVISTVQAAFVLAAGQTVGVSARVAGISEGVVKAMFLSKLQVLVAVVLAVSALALGLGLCTQPVLAQKASETNSRRPVQAAPKHAGQTDQPFRVLKSETGLVCLRSSPDGKKLATVTWEIKDRRIESAAQLWDVEQGKTERTLERAAPGTGNTQFQLRQVTFSKDGKVLAVTIDGARNGVRFGQIKLWDAQTGEEKRTINHDCDVTGVAFSPDGKKVAGSDLDGRVFLWNTADGTEDKVINVGQAVHAMAISPDGTTLAAGCWKGERQGEVSLCDLQTGQVKHRLGEQEIGHIYSVAFSPDGKNVAGGGNDRNVRIWDVETGLLKHVLESKATSYREVSYSPDGKLLAGAGPADVPVWEIESGKVVRTLRGHQGEVHSAVFSNRGDTITTCGSDKTIRFWRVLSAGK
jgi:RNA polymerase sigma factor (sigma-70 family)